MNFREVGSQISTFDGMLTLLLKNRTMETVGPALVMVQAVSEKGYLLYRSGNMNSRVCYDQ